MGESRIGGERKGSEQRKMFSSIKSTKKRTKKEIKSIEEFMLPETSHILVCD